MLNGLTFLDFSQRLPGPLGMKLLSSLGAKIIKIEDLKYQDSFLTDELSCKDTSFHDWYKDLNKNKEILRFDFSNLSDQLKIQELIKSSNGAISGLSHKLCQKIGLTEDNFPKTYAFVTISATKDSKTSMHDLNALAKSGALKLYTANKNSEIVPPPFLPIAGINFGQKIATDLLASYISSQKKQTVIVHHVSLLEATIETLQIFFNKKNHGDRNLFLHNGLYPCYCLYQTKDKKYVALAAIEPAFWKRFCKIFELNLNLKDRYHFEDLRVFNTIKDKFASLNYTEVEEMVSKEDICLSLV